MSLRGRCRRRCNCPPAWSVVRGSWFEGAYPNADLCGAGWRLRFVGGGAEVVQCGKGQRGVSGAVDGVRGIGGAGDDCGCGAAGGGESDLVKHGLAQLDGRGSRG